MRFWRRSVVVAAMAAGALVLPGEAVAQRGAPTGRAVSRPAPSGHHYYRPAYRPYYRPYYPYGYYRPYYYAPFAFSVGFASGWYGWWAGFGYPYYGYPHAYYGGPYGYAYPYPYYRDHVSSARIQAQPRHAEVFIDGYFVGTVDDFDGWSQRLDVEPGEHTLEIFLPGHRMFRQNVLFRPGASIRIEHVMQPLAAGETEEPRPVPPARATPARTAPSYTPRPADPGEAGPPPRSAPPAAAVEVQSREYGAIAVRVQPMDAEVLVDGEAWRSPQAGSITLQLSEGTHRVEVRKDGFRTYSAEIRVKRGETSSLNVSLSR